MKLFLKHATHRMCVTRGIKCALVVGTVLGLINHYHAIFTGTLTGTNIFQILLTYLVPYCVATYGSAMHARHLDLEEMKKDQTPEEDPDRIC